MSNHFSKPDPRNPSFDENDPVWRLLGESPRPEPDAWFAVRTVARCRYEEPITETKRFSPFRSWRWAFGGSLGISAALVLASAQVQAPSVSSNVSDKQKNVQEAFAIVASLDSDTDSSSSSSWQDSSL